MKFIYLLLIIVSSILIIIAIFSTEYRQAALPFIYLLSGSLLYYKYFYKRKLNKDN